MVNELLIQMQSFDQPPLGRRIKAKMISWMNGYLPTTWQMTPMRSEYSNILLIAATNRGDSLDPALLRPGRFDRRLYFDVPTQPGAPRPDRLLPGTQGPRRGARRRPGPRPDRGRDVRLHPGDDRAPLRRGAAAGAARRAPRDEPARHHGGEVQRGGRLEADDLLHRLRSRGRGHARGRARDGRLPRRHRAPARDPVDHQAPRVARHARPQRRGGAAHADEVRAGERHRDRARRPRGRGDVPGRVRAPAPAPTSRTPPSWPRRWSGRSAWPAR